MWPRPTSSHDNFHINAATMEGDEMIEIVGDSGEKIRNDETALLGFTEYTSDEHNRIDPSTTESSLNHAIAECNVIRSNPYFTEGILLKCVDSKPLYLYLHYAIFKNPDHDIRIGRIDQAIHELHNRSKSQFGAYDEIYAIQKLHQLRVINCQQIDMLHESLEKSWLNWSGAREIYKYSPRNWNLRRIVLHKMPISTILNPSNRLQALDMVERLRVRNCGYISLYQVQWSYGQVSNSLEASSTSQKLLPIPDGRWERNLMLRGFSQEVEPTINNISPSANSRKHSSNSMGKQTFQIAAAAAAAAAASSSSSAPSQITICNDDDSEVVSTKLN
ncbi:hypothetical protein DINM_005895 [Dirofilaria immitis]|nr:hypothetical protein [Dirofilaria immitis]